MLLEDTSAIICGREAKALAASIAPSATVIEEVEPLGALPDRLLATLPAGCSNRSIVLTDPDGAATLLDAPGSLEEIRRRIRGRLIMPVQGEDVLHLVSTNGLSPMEQADGHSWRWIEGLAAQARLRFYNAGPTKLIRFTFLPWFSGFALANYDSPDATLTYEDGAGSHTHEVQASMLHEATLQVSRGVSSVSLAVALPAGATSLDARILSLGLVDPSLTTLDGRALIRPEQFRAQPSARRFAVIREALHRAGFYEVGGTIPHAGGAANPVVTTRGSPHVGIHLEADGLADTEPAFGSSEVCWLVAGNIVGC